MWGYSIAAAALGVEHTSSSTLQVEPGAAMHPINDKAYIYHYTYGIELTANGKPQARRDHAEIACRDRVPRSRAEIAPRSRAEIACRDRAEIACRDRRWH